MSADASPTPADERLELWHILQEDDSEPIMAEGLPANSYLWSDRETAVEFAGEFYPAGDWRLAHFDGSGIPLSPDPEFGPFGDETLAWICSAPIGPERLLVHGQRRA